MLSNRTVYSPRIIQLTVADLPSILQLQETVTAELPPGYLRPKTESDLGAYLDGTLGVGHGVLEGNALTAMSLLRIPSEKHPNKHLLPFPCVPEEEWALHACVLQSSMVLPLARGRGYQRALFDVQLSHAVSAQMRWICAGVHLRNSASWINLLSKQMAIVGMRSDFGYPLLGLLRKVDGPQLASDVVDRVSVNAHDPSQHKAALHDGYIGVRIASDGKVAYQRLSLPSMFGGCLRSSLATLRISELSALH